MKETNNGAYHPRATRGAYTAKLSLHVVGELTPLLRLHPGK
jgi:hypothetical protein